MYPKRVRKVGMESLLQKLCGKTRAALLALLYLSPERRFYLRELSARCGTGHGAAQRELAHLTALDLVLRTPEGRQVYFRANPQCPIFAELRSLVVKTSPLHQVLALALEPLRDQIQTAFLYGGAARGSSRLSDIDVMIVADLSYSAVAGPLFDLQKYLQRELRPTVYPPAEFHDRVRNHDLFLRDVLRGPKVFLVGDERGLH